MIRLICRFVASVSAAVLTKAAMAGNAEWAAMAALNLVIFATGWYEEVERG